LCSIDLWARAKRKLCACFDNMISKSNESCDVLEHDQSVAYKPSLRRRRDFPICNSTNLYHCLLKLNYI
jgi:hypothetical protein